jgi:bifunctional DNase/RNase
MTHTDAELVALARSGDADAFRTLIERHRAVARSLAARLVARPETAEDLLQEALLLFYYDDLSLEEVAGRLELSPAAKSRLHKGRRQLQRRLVEVWPELAQRGPSGRRRPMTMREVRIVKLLPTVPRLLVALLDEQGRRLLPLWLRPDEAYAVVGATGLATSLLEATGATVRSVRLERLEEGLFSSELLLDGPGGQRAVKARLGDGLALAHRLGSPILVPEEVLADLGIGLEEHGSVERALQVAAGQQGIPLAAMQPAADRVAEPRNLRFDEGLRHWELRGSFLHDSSGAHWQDYTCDSDHGTGHLAARVPRPLGFADLRQAILADAYRGRRVRVSAEVRTAGVQERAGLYLRVIDPERKRPPEERRQAVVEGSRNWSRLHAEAEVPEDSVFVLFGISLNGPGEVWVRDVELTPTG